MQLIRSFVWEDAYWIVAIAIIFIAYLWRAKVVAKRLRGYTLRLWIKATLRVTALVAMGLALLGPFFEQGLSTFSVNERHILFVFDLSASMETNDAGPADNPNALSRIKSAQLNAERLLALSQKDNFTVIGYAWQALVLCPPSSDLEAVKTVIAGLNPKLWATPAGNPVMALNCVKQLPAADLNQYSQIYWFTDGADLGQPWLNAIDSLKIPTSVVLIGKQAQDETVKAAPNAPIPNEVTALLGGHAGLGLFKMGPQSDNQEALIDHFLALRSRYNTQNQQVLAQDQYHFVLLIALTAMVIDILFTFRVIKIKPASYN